MIRIPINLATEPFRRDRPMLVASAALAVLLIATLLIQTGMIVSQRAQAADTRIALEKLNAQLAKVGADQAKLNTTLRLPENAEVLERSLFLNDIIQHKAISLDAHLRRSGKKFCRTTCGWFRCVCPRWMRRTACCSKWKWGRKIRRRC